jgi:salicylate hydroxylase
MCQPLLLQVGGGIQIPPNGAKVLERLGLLSQLREAGTELESLHLRRYQDGKLLSSRPLGETTLQEYGAPWL